MSNSFTAPMAHSAGMPTVAADSAGMPTVAADVSPEPTAPVKQWGSGGEARMSAELVVQWGSGGEARMSAEDMDTISEGVSDYRGDNYRSLFPLHGGFGALNLDIGGRTLWLYTHGGAFIVGELVEPHMLRTRPGIQTTSVDISRLPADQQAAILTLLRR